MTDLVEVRDRKNPDRLLGHLPRVVDPLAKGMKVEMAVPPRMSAFHYAPDTPLYDPIPIERALFHIDYRFSDGGYTARAEFLTDAPLSTLMQLRPFRLPGETEREARYRQERCW